MSQTIVYKEDWRVKLQERLSEPTKWKDICRVEYTNARTIHNPYETDATVQTHTRGTAYTFQDITLTDDTAVINVSRNLPQYIDWADLAQTTYVSQMERADAQGVLINEAIETYLYSLHAQFTDFDNASIGGNAGNITVSATNIDDVIRGVKREIREAKGEAMLERYGGFFVWRPADFEILEAFVQANGTVPADNALQNGTKQGLNYMGLTHYSSNLLASGHLFAGVKNTMHLGIVKDTYGMVNVVPNPAGASGGVLSGVGVESRVDMVGKAWAKVAPILFDVLVA